MMRDRKPTTCALASARRSSQQSTALERREIEVDGLPVAVSYKRVKTLTLRVKPPDGRVEISAPVRISEAELVGLVRKKRSWIDAKRREIAESPSARADEADPAEVARWRELVAACVPVLLERWEAALGVHAATVVYRNMKSRWGSCQPATGRICINVRLALYPPECLEYVVVHELCHLRERGHGSAFRALMDAALPDWRLRRAKLH